LAWLPLDWRQREDAKQPKRRQKPTLMLQQLEGLRFELQILATNSERRRRF
jgi:hypothetical protein